MTLFWETWWHLDEFANHEKEKDPEVNYEAWKVNYMKTLQREFYMKNKEELFGVLDMI